MKKIKLLFILVISVLTLFFFWNKASDSDLKDNYYQAINREILDNNILEDGEYSWSYFGEAQEIVDDDMKEIVGQILNGETHFLDDNEIRAIQSIYNKALNMEQRDKNGIKELDVFLDRVWNVSSIEELIDVIIVIESDLGIDILTNVAVMADYKDNSKNIIYFVPVTFAFGASSDYIINDDYMTYKAYLRRACVQLWKTYGRDDKEAREIVNRVFSFYEDVSEHSKLSIDLEDIASYYQVVSKKDVIDILGNIGEKYLSRRGFGDRDTYSLVDEGQYQYLRDSLTSDKLNVWKEVIVTKILSSYASYASSDYVKIVDDLNESWLGDVKDDTNEDRAILLVKDLFANEIDMVYEKVFLNKEKENEIEEMVLEIKKNYEKRLRNNEWLSEKAIEKALVKLEEMEVVVGLNEDNIGYGLASSLEVSNGSFIQDIIKMKQLIWKKEIGRLDNGEKINLISQGVVNAYYQPLDNSIVIPVAFFELIGEDKSYYEKLGTLGMILAHEVTHGFDSNGSQFDEFGNLNNWWTEEDKMLFEELKKSVSAYYGKYEVLTGKYINGKKTVNENIADLGAVACISEIAFDKGASEGEIKEMFSSFAEIWASHESEEYMKLLLLQDVHAPNEFRVNAVLSSMDEFYRVYDIYPWNGMWIGSDQRVSVW